MERAAARSGPSTRMLEKGRKEFFFIRAIVAVTIRGAQMALGKYGRVHIAWNGHAPEKGSYMEAPMLYTRLNDAGTAFEPERDVITFARGLDGGGSVAADDQGNVYVAWHAPKPGNTNGEAGRAWSWHDPKRPLPKGNEWPLFKDAKNNVSFVDGHVSYIKIYWEMKYSPTAAFDPPAGHNYQWSGD
jgi:prepilin-type processing-associated H-X9-DG protein